MSTIRITKRFSFETGHALYGYDGKCRNVHGHSYKLFVTVIGHPISDTTHVKLGMVIDFSDLKVIVKNKILGVTGRTIPTMLNYNTHINQNSMFNTPPVFAIYVSMFLVTRALFTIYGCSFLLRVIITHTV